MTDLVSLVERSLSGEADDAFAERVRQQADRLRGAIEAGEFDNGEFAVGLEMELYAVEAPEASGDPAEWDCRLQALPESVFDGPASKELGVHNAELNTDPSVLDDPGLEAQAEAIAADYERARADAGQTDCELVLDAMWTVPPEEGTDDYLTTREGNGVTVARNMRRDPRYVAIDNDALASGGDSLSLSVPGLDRAFPTILFESLATSIQPHLQIPRAAAFPAYYNTAIRTLGPVLALSTNSPFLPGDLYDVDDPAALVEDTYHELRIPVFEQSVNQTPNPKVRVPEDIESAGEVVDRVVADDTYAPFLREWLDDSPRETLAERNWEFDYKRGSYWRWLRCVVGGDPVGTGDERSLRIEYRPLPTQPTVRDVVGLQALTAGLIRGLVAADHPLAELPWSEAEAAFYSATREGLDADLAWLTADGDHTTDHDTIFAEVFEYAREGLAAAGVSGAAIEGYLAPIEARWSAATTPSIWTKDRVRDRLSEGLSLEAAIARTQREYVRLSRDRDSFADWF